MIYVFGTACFVILEAVEFYLRPRHARPDLVQKFLQPDRVAKGYVSDTTHQSMLQIFHEGRKVSAVDYAFGIAIRVRMEIFADPVQHALVAQLL